MIAGFDHFFLMIWHAVANPVFTFLFKVVTFLGEKGIIFFLAAIILMLFPRTRKLGVCIFGAVACGALISNIILKDLVARPRPFEDHASDYYNWWLAVGAPAEDGFSFPSGHVTAAAAGCTAIVLMKGKKYLVPSVIWVVIMMIARNYLMVHYPTDVIAGCVIGILSGFISFYITKYIFDFLRKKRKQKWADMCLNFSIPALDTIAYYKLPAIIEIMRAKIPAIPGISASKKAGRSAPAKKAVSSGSVPVSKHARNTRNGYSDEYSDSEEGMTYGDGIQKNDYEKSFDSSDIAQEEQEEMKEKQTSKFSIKKPDIKLPKFPGFNAFKKDSSDEDVEEYDESEEYTEDIQDEEVEEKSKFSLKMPKMPNFKSSGKSSSLGYVGKHERKK